MADKLYNQKSPVHKRAGFLFYFYFMDFVLLCSYTNYIDAHIVMGRLEQENIRCHLQNEYTVTIDPILTNAIGGIKLMVARAQVERALQILSEGDKQTESLSAIPS